MNNRKDLSSPLLYNNDAVWIEEGVYDASIVVVASSPSACRKSTTNTSLWTHFLQVLTVLLNIKFMLLWIYIVALWATNDQSRDFWQQMPEPWQGYAFLAAVTSVCWSLFGLSIVGAIRLQRHYLLAAVALYIRSMVFLWPHWHSWLFVVVPLASHWALYYQIGRQTQNICTESY